jgi:hypothetical protein
MQNEIDEKTRIINDLECRIAMIMKEKNLEKKSEKVGECECRYFAQPSAENGKLLAVEQLADSLSELTVSIFSEGIK